MKDKMKVTVKESAPEHLKRLTGFDVFSCPKCSEGRMMEVEQLPRIRSPGWITRMLLAKYTHK